MFWSAEVVEYWLETLVEVDNVTAWVEADMETPQQREKPLVVVQGSPDKVCLTGNKSLSDELLTADF